MSPFKLLCTTLSLVLAIGMCPAIALADDQAPDAAGRQATIGEAADPAAEPDGGAPVSEPEPEPSAADAQADAAAAEEPADAQADAGIELDAAADDDPEEGEVPHLELSLDYDVLCEGGNGTASFIAPEAGTYRFYTYGDEAQVTGHAVCDSGEAFDFESGADGVWFTYEAQQDEAIGLSFMSDQAADFYIGVELLQPQGGDPDEPEDPSLPEEAVLALDESATFTAAGADQVAGRAVFTAPEEGDYAFYTLGAPAVRAAFGADEVESGAGDISHTVFLQQGEQMHIVLWAWDPAGGEGATFQLCADRLPGEDQPEEGAKSIADATVRLDSSGFTYDGNPVEPGFKVTYRGSVLAEGVDYEASISDNVDAGDAAITVTGKGEFEGTLVKTFRIEPAPITSLALSYTSCNYTGNARKPYSTVTAQVGGRQLTLLSKKLTGNDDVELVFSSGRTDAGTYTVTAKGKGNYGGSITKSFTIKPVPITGLALSYTSCSYTGKARQPYSTVTATVNGQQKTLLSKKLSGNDDVAITASSGRINAGTYTVTATGRGNYTGTVTKSFAIKPVPITSASLSTTAYTYNGYTKAPAVTVKATVNGASKTIMSAQTKSSTSVGLSYSSGRKYVGAYKVTVTGKGNYTGTKTLAFKINPKGTSLTGLTAGSGSLTAKWSKQPTQTSGYQVRYSRYSSMSGAKTVTVSGTSTVSKKITGLTKGKRYYVQVRTYKTVNGVKYYSGWSTAKYATVK